MGYTLLCLVPLLSVQASTRHEVALEHASLHDSPLADSPLPDVTKFKTKAPWGEDPYKSVDSTVKSAFTRAFNQQHVKPKTGFGLEDAKKRKGGGKKGKGSPGAAEEDEEEDMEGLGEAGLSLLVCVLSGWAAPPV